MSRRPRIRSRLGRWLALGGLVVVGLLYYKPVRGYLDTRRQVAARAAEVRKLEARRANLRARFERSEEGRDLLRQARKLGLVKPGERLFIVKGIDAWRRAGRRIQAP